MESQPPKLLDHVRGAIRARHYSRRTEEAYVYWLRRFIVFHGKRHPSEMGAPEIGAFLFLYRHVLHVDPGVIEHVPRAAVPVRVPVVLSGAEVRAVLDRLEGVCRLVASLLYGAGLRLHECLELRVKDIDFDRAEVVVRHHHYDGLVHVRGPQGSGPRRCPGNRAGRRREVDRHVGAA